MHLEVTPTLGRPFQCTFLYTATYKKIRMNMCYMFDAIAKNVSGPWMVVSDFNCVANLNERLGQVNLFLAVPPLRICMDTCELHDMKWKVFYLE